MNVLKLSGQALVHAETAERQVGRAYLAFLNDMASGSIAADDSVDTMVGTVQSLLAGADESIVKASRAASDSQDAVAALQRAREEVVNAQRASKDIVPHVVEFDNGALGMAFDGEAATLTNSHAGLAWEELAPLVGFT